ncbi:MAG: Adenylate kinase [Candidatus Moranbacteria bacterium GW2011_GWC1_45_18]|nr:MAG: Adenylate kinase [Candidatus Moranbacteria bacterium GW2011_GWC2_40_12]KKT33886.1 MAG: Adenylate kinase [Candidatus Moranbacteria bacterium GW2011_GWF2_44_10]KKT71877.1 MAG: Adenylate kinase [Candidatus Moranbacteria bacterium GW2011_GWF1_44_4]KKT99786.1 MAG: Adenylate kinase [Candidatus Moranbacteria bacterium GW2011_GWC1_45_18]OGI34968.1 MAG: hypothetical protein A2407_00370 [Candidatus Moranbacteria bacterium RIFOXYC1_FULL_44_8]OGI39528.1 MAG: hypothetical protein A2374_03330 [Candi
MNIIILGPQGSGKGTQAKMLAEKFGLEHVEMGKLLRDVAKLDSPLGKKVHETINIQGKLVENRVIEEVLDAKLDGLPSEKGIIFDGVPRSESQREYIERKIAQMGRKIESVIDINLPEEETIERLSKRWVCENEHVLIMGKDVKGVNEKCPICGSEIRQRIDDTPERIKTRLDIYHKDTKPVIDYYRGQGILIEIDGRPSIKEVSEDILKKIKRI